MNIEDLKHFKDEAYLSVSQGLMIISNLRESIVVASPVEDATISVSAYISKDHIKSFKDLKKVTNSNEVFLRSATEDHVTFTSKGLDISIPTSEDIGISIRQKLKNFWEETKYQPLKPEFFQYLKRACPFMSKDESRFSINQVLIGEKIVCTNGHALIALENPNPEVQLQIPSKEAEFVSTWKRAVFGETEEDWIISNRKQSIIIRKDVSTFPDWENVIPNDLSVVPINKSIRKLIVSASKFPSSLGEPHFEMTASEGIITIEAIGNAKRFKKNIENFRVKFDASKIKTEAKSIMSFQRHGDVNVFRVPNGTLILMGIRN